MWNKMLQSGSGGGTTTLINKSIKAYQPHTSDSGYKKITTVTKYNDDANFYSLDTNGYLNIIEDGTYLINLYNVNPTASQMTLYINDNIEIAQKDDIIIKELKAGDILKLYRKSASGTSTSYLFVTKVIE